MKKDFKNAKFSIPGNKADNQTERANIKLKSQKPVLVG
jgi:hypothetical protein